MEGGRSQESEGSGAEGDCMVNKESDWGKKNTRGSQECRR